MKQDAELPAPSASGEPAARRFSKAPTSLTWLKELHSANGGFYRRLSIALTSTDPDSHHAYLEPDERARLVEILRATFPEFGELRVR